MMSEAEEAAYARGIEDAAKVADGFKTHGEPIGQPASYRMASSLIAQAIRALKGKKPCKEARFKSDVTSQRSYMYGVGHNTAVLLHPDGTSELIKLVVPMEADDE